MHFRLLGGLSLLDSYKSDPYGMTTILDICQDLKVSLGAYELSPYQLSVAIVSVEFFFVQYSKILNLHNNL